MKELFGVSGIANIIGAIKMAKYLKLGPDDNVVTIATDGFDRYDSVMEDLETRYELADTESGSIIPPILRNELSSYITQNCGLFSNIEIPR